MKRKLMILGLSIVLANSLMAITNDTTTNRKPSLEWSGFVAANAIWDSRQNVEAREGFLLLYPKTPALDLYGNDINARPTFNLYAMTSRIKLTAKGPELKGFKSMAVVECDFTGASNVENNSMRLRHGYLTLEKKHLRLLLGQYWHPLDIPEMLPQIVSLNTGAPFRSFARQPQVRMDWKYLKSKWVIAASTQRDYVNTGPAEASTEYLRNSALPDLSAEWQLKSQTLLVGIALNYKKLTPRLKTDKGISVRETVDAKAVSGFVQNEWKGVGIKSQIIYGQCLNDHLMLGGYGVCSIRAEDDYRKYSPLNYMSGYAQLYTKYPGCNFQLFAGYSRGMGSGSKIVDKVYARDPKMAWVWRVSPTVTYAVGNLTLAGEVELTQAAWGEPDENYLITEDVRTANFRLSLQVTYGF